MNIFGKERDPNWLDQGMDALKYDGFFVLKDVVQKDFLTSVRAAMYEAQKKITAIVGHEKLRAAGEVGVLRTMFRFDPIFFKFLEMPEVLRIVDITVSNSAIMHLQNGFILPSLPPNDTPKVFQNRFHRDFKRILNGYMCSINTFFAIDDFNENNGATLVVPGTHQVNEEPSLEYSQKNAIPLVCPAGSMVVFDSTLWHAAGVNSSGKDRLAINHQFTRSYIKQQVDYVRSVDISKLGLHERTKQLLGWYTRIPTSIEDFYVPPNERLYRADQG
jgi:ectoine hydroxylase-related dioxygenase (phytanoyl-CoA dioxygenase family)